MTALTTRPETPGTTPAPAAYRPPATDRLREVLASRVPGRSLPGAAYTDPDLHEVDLALVWQRQWVFVGTVAELREPGDYLTVDLGRASVMVLRDDDEQVQAFRNVCRHRGARLLDQPRGSVGNIVCGYHRWTYGTDGALMHAPQLAPGTDTSCLGLRSVHLREIGGMLFVNLSPDPEGTAAADVDDVARVLAPYLAPHALDRAKVAAQVDLVEQGNWKLTMENNRECYHCDGHPELLATFFPTWGLADHQVPKRLRASHERYLAAEVELQAECDRRGVPTAAAEDLTDRGLGFRVQREALDGAGESFSRDGSALVAKLLGDLDLPRMGRATVHLQPNVWAHFLADHVVTFAVLPVSVDQTLVRTTWLVHEDAVEGVDYDVAALTDVWRHTNEQDADFVSLTQQGVADPAYEPGPYSEAERQVDAFVSWYVARVEEEAAR